LIFVDCTLHKFFYNHEKKLGNGGLNILLLKRPSIEEDTRIVFYNSVFLSLR